MSEFYWFVFVGLLIGWAILWWHIWIRIWRWVFDLWDLYRWDFYRVERKRKKFVDSEKPPES